MIDSDRKVIFVHVPKTAGQSIETYFLKLNDLTFDRKHELLLMPNSDPRKGPPRLAHLTMQEYYEFGYISASETQGFFKFSFVRNPWARMVSFYRYLRFNQIISFDDFVRVQFPSLVESEYWRVRPQSEFTHNNKLPLVDFIGMFERLDEDFEQVCSILNIRFTKLPHLNSSSESQKLSRHLIKFYLKNWRYFLRFEPDKMHHKDYRMYYNDSLADIVAKFYSSDLELFGYQFDHSQ